MLDIISTLPLYYNFQSYLGFISIGQKPPLLCIILLNLLYYSYCSFVRVCTRTLLMLHCSHPSLCSLLYVYILQVPFTIGKSELKKLMQTD